MVFSEKYGITVCEFDVTDSTNEQAKSYAKSGYWTGDNLAFIANEQTNGRGRYSRKFYSKSGVGAYLSLLFKPNSNVNNVTPIIALAAVSMTRAIELLSSATPKIKWVNDIILNDKKLGGILIEGSINPESKSYNYLIVGIGVNLYSTELDEEIKGIATSLEDETGEKINKTELIGKFIQLFFEGFKNLDSDELFDEYRSRLITIGKDVTVKAIAAEYYAKAIDLNRDYSLLVTTPSGEKKRIYTGEVSVKPK